MKQPCVYMMSNQLNGTLYIGVTSDLVRRVYEHKSGVIAGFTHKYGLKNLGWYEVHEHMESAIVREKQLKAGSRAKKIELIARMNPKWFDLYDEIV